MSGFHVYGQYVFMFGGIRTNVTFELGSHTANKFQMPSQIVHSSEYVATPKANVPGLFTT